MPSSRRAQHLFDPARGGEAVRVLEVAGGPAAVEPKRTNYFSVYHIASGGGEFSADAAGHAFAAPALVFFTPYQYVRFEPAGELRADLVQFHANFLCVETFHAESGCAGVLFSDPYHPPVVALDRSVRREVADLIKRMHREQAAQALGYEDMLLAQLKALLILATRVKCRADAAEGAAAGTVQPRHPVLRELKELIEANYRTLHAPADYAQRLHMTPKTLGRVVREQLGKSLTELIRERILTHSKWQLLHTLRPVKEIAAEVGYRDELYFSRMFKKATGFSPTFFREFETEIRGGSNLSMLSVPPSIPRPRGAGR